MSQPTAADRVLHTLADHGVHHLFANPGTTELAFLPALERQAAIRGVLVVDETVASGAADGVARMTDAPAATLLHLGAGLANAGANLHNANKARSPQVTLVGDHALGHRDLPSPLQCDIAALAAPLSRWVGTVGPDGDAESLTAAATQAARVGQGNATLIIPADLAAAPAPPDRAADAAPSAVARAVGAPAIPSGPSIDGVAAAIRQGGAALLLGGPALRGTALRTAAAIARAHAVDLWAPMFNARVERTAPVPLRKLPYFPGQAAAVLAGYRTVVRVGAELPVAMFAYPGEPHLLAPGEVVLATPADDSAAALTLLADALGVAPASAPSEWAPRPAAPTAGIDLFSLAAALGATLPMQAIVIDEGQTSSLGLWDAIAGVPHDLLALTGGAIGGGPRSPSGPPSPRRVGEW